MGHREQATLTFGNDIQDHVERDESSNHEQEGSRVCEGELDGPVAVIEEPDDQGHQAGLCSMDKESWQVSEVVENLTTYKTKGAKGTTYTSPVTLAMSCNLCKALFSQL